MARKGDARSFLHCGCLYSDRVRQWHSEDRPRHGERKLHGRGYRYYGQWSIAVPDDRECSHHGPVALFARANIQEIKEKSMLSKIGRIAGRAAMAFFIMGVLSTALAWAGVGG